MKKLAIYGAGGLGREVALLVRQINLVSSQWNLIGFYDDHVDQVNSDLPILGGVDELNAVQSPLCIIVAVADPATRKKIVKRIINPNIEFPVVIHPGANTGDHTNRFGRGSIITAGNQLTTGITIGEFVIVNLSCTIGHDVLLADFTAIMPGSNISGNVRVGSETLIGTGARILQNITIGKLCRVGAGAVVTRSVPDGKTVVGIPARPR